MISVTWRLLTFIEFEGFFYTGLVLEALYKELGQGFRDTLSHTSSQNHEELHSMVIMNSSFFFCLASVFMSLENPAHPQQRTTTISSSFGSSVESTVSLFLSVCLFSFLAQASCSSTLHTATDDGHRYVFRSFTCFISLLLMRGTARPKARRKNHNGGFAGQGRCQDDLRRDSLPRTKGQISFTAVEDSLPSSEGRRRWTLSPAGSARTRYWLSKCYDPA